MESSRRAPVRSSTPVRSAFAACAVFLAVGASPARAQYVDEIDALLPPRILVWRLSDRGFTEISRPRFDGRAYVVEASNPYGERVRLFLDGRDGGILGRQRLQAPLAPSVRVGRSMPGYGWTEDDLEPRRAMRQAERMLPPVDIPSAPGPTRSEGNPDRNPFGTNPETKARPDMPRRTVRLAPPVKPAAPRATPEAPKPAEAMAPTAPSKPVAAPKPETPSAALEQPPSVAPAVQPPAVEKPAAETTQTPAAQTWKDPPPEAKRPVRVIGGATVVPGTAGKEPGAAE